jgi:hypothetical protein
VRLKDDKGGPVQHATVLLVGCAPGATKHRVVPGEQPRELGPKDFDGDWARLADLPAGDFVLLVESPLFAKSLSKPFTVPADRETEVVITLGRGGVLEGCVVGPDKKPLAGAVVRSENGDDARKGALGSLLSALLVDTTTTTHAATGADGCFRLERLAQGEYRLVVDHADFVRAEVEVEVRADAAKKLAPVQLANGVLVTGRVMRGTRAVAGAEVTFQFEDAAAMTDLNRAGKVRSYKTTTDDRGDFRLPARVPAGKGYVLMAAEPGPPLQQAQQLQASRRRFDVQAGNREQVQLLQLPER